jgi:hypothetical protein
LGSKVGQLKPEFEKLGSDFRKLGLVKFLWDKKEEIQVEARAVILNKRLGLGVAPSNTDKAIGGHSSLKEGEQSSIHETPNFESAAPTAEPSRAEGVAGAQIEDPLREFKELNVNSVAPNFGVYSLYANGELVLYGCTESQNQSIRSCLQIHFQDQAHEVRQWGITHYQREFTETVSDAMARYAELLEMFRRENDGRLPRYNTQAA